MIVQIMENVYSQNQIYTHSQHLIVVARKDMKEMIVLNYQIVDALMVIVS